MEKFISSKHSALGKNLPFSYYSTPLYLDFAAYFFERNGEPLLVWQDMIYPNEFPCLFIPRQKNNWPYCAIACTTEEDIEAIKKEQIEILVSKFIGNEFFYRTEDFINPKGSFKDRVDQFNAHYKYILTHTCDKERIIAFYTFWKSQREHTSITFKESEVFFHFCLDHLDTYDVKQLYVESEGNIIGLAWGIKFPESNNWIGLHLKVDYQYKGLSRFLHHERAKLFEDCKEFSLGTGVHDAGIDAYKEELGPINKRAYYYVLTGGKQE